MQRRKTTGVTRPELKARHQRAVSVYKNESLSLPDDGLPLQQPRRPRRNRDCCKRFDSVRASHEKTMGLRSQVGEFDIIHDDEPIEQRHERLNLRGRGLQQQAVGLGPNRGIALDASLRAEQEGVSTLARRKRLHRIGHHAVQPAHAVITGDGNPTSARRLRPKQRDTSPSKQGRCWRLHRCSGLCGRRCWTGLS